MMTYTERCRVCRTAQQGQANFFYIELIPDWLQRTYIKGIDTYHLIFTADCG